MCFCYPRFCAAPHGILLHFWARYIILGSHHDTSVDIDILDMVVKECTTTAPLLRANFSNLYITAQERLEDVRHCKSSPTHRPRIHDRNTGMIRAARHHQPLQPQHFAVLGSFGGIWLDEEFESEQVGSPTQKASPWLCNGLLFKPLFSQLFPLQFPILTTKTI